MQGCNADREAFQGTAAGAAPQLQSPPLDTRGAFAWPPHTLDNERMNE